MAGPVHKARMARKEKNRPKPGTLLDLQSVLWKAMTKLEAHMDSTKKSDTARLTKLTHALSQAAASYLRVVEVGELEARIAELEQRAGAEA